jgi:predicted O-linked N-acetylglucosamine transferase (SPINDLY family)
MAKGEKEVPELVRTAETLERELSRLEALSRSVRKIRLDSEKSIARAAKELSEALLVPDRIAAGLQALAAAMERMSARQQGALEPLATSATELQERMRKLGAHMQAFADLGNAAREATELLRSEPAEKALPSDTVQAQLTKIVEGARALFETARADDFPDVAREADALRQRVSSLRGRLDRKA